MIKVYDDGGMQLHLNRTTPIENVTFNPFRPHNQRFRYNTHISICAHPRLNGNLCKFQPAQAKCQLQADFIYPTVDSII